MASLRIAGTGIHTGSLKISNDAIAIQDKYYDENRAGISLPKWIEKYYGISYRYHAASDEMPSDMAYRAALKAIEAAGIDKEQIDFILVNTVFGDFSQPTTATALQHKLGLNNKTFALEINMPCSGPVYSLFLADSLMKNPVLKTGLLIGVDKISPFIDQQDFRVSSLFSDAAGACVVTRSDKGGILDYYLKSSGETAENISDYSLVIPGGKAKQPRITNHNQQDLYLHMNAPLVKGFIQDTFSDVYKGLVPKHEIDRYVPHQASLSALREVFEAHEIPWSKAVMTLDAYGNTSSASVYFGLDKFMRSAKRSGEKILIYAMGGGLNWGGLVYQHI